MGENTNIPQLVDQTSSNDINEMIDRIIRLSSLASRREDVDPMMDTLRNVTARWKGSGEMPAADQSALKDLESKLKIYLVTKDPLRSFTIEALEEQVAGQKTSQKVRLNSFTVSILLSLGLAAFATLVPIGALRSRLLLAVPVFFVVLHVCMAWLYITALRNFRNELRHTYQYFAVAAILYSLAFSHFALITLFHLDATYAWLRYGGITWLVALPFGCTYLGLRIYAKRLDIKSRFTSFVTIAALTGLASVLPLVIPHRTPADPLYFYLGSLGAIMIMVFIPANLVLARKIYKTVTESYANSIRWLYYYNAIVILGTPGAIAAIFIFGSLHGDVLNTVTGLFGVAPQIVLLYSSYLFNKEVGR